MKPWVFAAGKGGVGTTTVAALLAVEAGLAGFRTLLVDGNVGLAGLHRSFGVLDGNPGFASLQDRSLDPEGLLLVVSPNVWLLPGGGGAPDAPLVNQGGRLGAYRRVSRLFGEYDLVLIDGGSTLESILPVAQIEPQGLWTVTVGERIAMAGAYALIKVITARHPDLPMFPLFNCTTRREADSLSASMNGASLRFLRSRLGAAGNFPRIAALSAASRLTDAPLGEEAAAALSALLPRILSPSRSSA